MPKRDPRGPLLDMRAYAQAAIRIAGEMTLDDLRASEVSRLALERALEIVGEAANRVQKRTRDALGGIPWSEIIGLRNILAHAYDSVRDEILLNVVRHNLPPFLQHYSSGQASVCATLRIDPVSSPLDPPRAWQVLSTDWRRLDGGYWLSARCALMLSRLTALSFLARSLPVSS